MRRVTLIGLAAMMMGAMGCSSSGEIGTPEGVPQGPQTEEPNPEITAALVLDEHTDTRTVGHLRTADGTLSFIATFVDAEHVTVQITINGKTFDSSQNGPTVVIDGHDAVLTVAEKSLLAGFATALTEKLGGVPEQTHDLVTYRYAAFLSIAPDGYVHKRIETVDEPQTAGFAAGPPPDGGVWGNEGKTCIKIGTTVTTNYSATPARDAGGDGGLAYYMDPVVVGSDAGKVGTSDYSCMGRCGAGCSGFGGGWTKDCLDHDECSFKFHASGGASDPNCGDEYSAASDDIFASCSGK